MTLGDSEESSAPLPNGDIPNVGADGRRMPTYMVPIVIIGFIALIGMAVTSFMASNKDQSLKAVPPDTDNPLFAGRERAPAPPPIPKPERTLSPVVAPGEPAPLPGLSDEQLRMLLAKQELERRQREAAAAEAARNRQLAEEAARKRDEATEGFLADFTVAPKDGAAPVAGNGSLAVKTEESKDKGGSEVNELLANYEQPDTSFVGRLPNLSTRITQGRIIDAQLETAISTELPGLVRAFVSEDVYSHDGRCLLIPRFSTIIGEHSSSVRRGGHRVGVIWNRIITPKGLDVVVRSPATDGVGRSGVPGEVDRHLWERFGASVLLSLLAVQMDSYDDRRAQAVGQSMEGVAEIALRDSINIPPTVYVPHGQTHLKVFVARDLEFAGVLPQKQRCL